MSSAPSNQEPDALAAAASPTLQQAFGAALPQSSPQVAARVCMALGDSLQLCRGCGVSPGEAAHLTPQQLAAVVKQLVVSLQHAAEPEVLASGLRLLLRMAGCSRCHTHTSRELQDTLGAAVAVPAAAAALQALSAAAAAAQRAAIAEGLQALHFLCNQHAANLAQLASGGGIATVAAAMAAGASEWPAEEHGLLLLAQLACRDGAALEERQAAAATIWAAGQAQVERRMVEVSRAAVWGMARLLQALQAAAPASPAAAALVAELQLQGTAVALAMLQSCDKKDDPLVKHCLDFLAVVAGGSSGPMPSALAAALLSREAAAAVLAIAGQASEPRMVATALCTLYCLCWAGSCGLTWQQLASCQVVEQQELVAGSTSVAAAVLAVTTAQAAAGSAKDGAGAGTPAGDTLAVHLYGLAAVGALLDAADTRSPGAGTALSAALSAQQLSAAQDAVAAACGTLARHPQLLAALDQQSGESSYRVELDSSELCCHLVTWQEAVAWQPAASAVSCACRLLRCAPEGINTADRDGWTLLHRLAEAGHAPCLQLLLAQGGEALDLLARTRGGANALQLAREGRAAGCVQLLEAATQAAAEARQEELLRELEEMEMEEDESGAARGAGKKASKKKNAMTRSTSFAAEQPDEKSQRLGSSGTSSGTGSESAEAGAEAEAEAQQQLEERLRSHQEMEAAYERALEERRHELAALQAAAAAGGDAAMLDAGTAGATAHGSSEDGLHDLQSHGSGSCESKQPGTPDQQDELAVSATSAPTPAAGAPPQGTLPAGSGGSSSPEPSLPAHEQQGSTDTGAAPASLLSHGLGSQGQQAQQAQQAQQGLLSTGLAGLGPLGFLQQQQQQQAAATALGGGSSLFGGSADGSSLFGSPAMAAGLHGLPGTSASPHGATQGGSLDSFTSSLSGSPFPSTGLGSPAAAHPRAHAFAPRSPPGSTAPFPSPATATPSRAGLPPLPGRQASFGAALAAAAAPAASMGATSSADQMLALRLRDALFVGAPSPAASPAHGAAAGSPQAAHRHPLFASLAPGGGGGSGGAHDDDVHSIHLLSGSLSCLDDDGGSGGGMLSRSLSASGSGSMAAAAAQLAQQEQHAAAAAAESLMAGLRRQGFLPGGSVPGLGGQPSEQLLASLAGPASGSLDSPGGCDAASDGSAGSAAQRAAAAKCGDNSDESLEPTRHLWIGNLGTRTPRAVLKTIFERFGTVDDVVTFPGRMYAFVNFRGTEEAVLATNALQDQAVPELTGDRRLLIKYRPAKKAAVHLRALGLVDEDGVPTDDRLDLDRDGNSTEPSPRIWLGNIAPTATSKQLHAVLGRYGGLTDAAVFPARIGPLGYAFVKFERLEDAVRAFESLNNTVVPPLSGSKQLKMRYKPAHDGPVGREDPSDPGKALMVPSRHLWLGNITQKPSDEQVLDVFASFGKVDSVRVFPVKAYAFVNYSDIGSAIKAMQAVDGLAIPQLTGVKPLVMRYQQESGGGSAASTPKLPGSGSSLGGPGLIPRIASEAAMAQMGLNQLVPGSSLASLLTGAASAPATVAASAAATSAGEGSGSDDGLVPVPNLSNKLNPNNIHYDAELAERYKHMNRREKDLMWAADSLLHPVDPAKGLLRSHSMGLLHGSPHTSAAAAATAQAHAALAVLLQQQQHAGVLPGSAEQAQLQRAVAGGSAHSGLQAGQLSMHPAMPPAQQSQLPTGASASQLTAVLNNLTAMRRTGFMPSPSHGGGGHLAMHPQGQPGGSAAQQQQAGLLQQLALLQQQSGGAAAHGMEGYGAGASTPAHQIQRLSSMLASQSLGPPAASPHSRSSTPLLSSHSSGHLGSLGSLGPQHSGGLHGMLSPQHSGGLHRPPSPAGHHHARQLSGGAGGQLSGSLPPHFICPLSRQIMTDPVMAADGVTYERQAITEWLAFKDVSPTTQMLMPHKALTPNTVLRASLLDLLRHHC